MDPIRTAGRARMINFACRCSHRFSLPDDQAGGVIQCPSCHRLCDIPNLSDLGHLDTDGNFLFDDDGMIPLADEERLPTLHKVFTRSHTDETGEEIDLRPTMHDVMNAGTEEIPYELAEQVKPAPPKYDPLTGELIKPLDIKGGGPARIDPKTVPMAKRAVEYAGADLSRGVGILGIGWQLLQPVNLFVMSVIVLVHLLLQPVNLMMAAGLFLVAPLFIIGVGFLLAHYGNVVEDTGPGERDELPRPLRDAELHADIWVPFTHVAGSVMICFWPAFFAARMRAPLAVVMLLILLGSFVLPAVLLTLSTSGTPANLRPDRVIGVIAACGVNYFLSVALLVGAYFAYRLGLWRFMYDSLSLFTFRNAPGGATAWWFEPWIAYPALLMGVYLAHWFCWSLGAAYRAHHDQFPWILQRHVATRFRDRTTLPAQQAAQRTANTNSAAVKQKLGTR
jgi:hypothetical protein